MSRKRCAWIILFLVGAALIGCQLPYEQGRELYVSACANCHMEDGSGLAELIPPLNGSDLVRRNPDLLPCLVRYGMEGPATVKGITYNQAMAPVTGLNDVELANILNYIQYQWGDPDRFYSPDEIRRILKGCDSRPVILDFSAEE